jgi:hypothetical protein
VKPSAINTPYVEHARNYMDEAPALPPPIYSPDVVAEAILRCAEKSVRDITVGGAGRATAVLGMVAPRTMDLYMERAMFSQQKDHTGSTETLDSLDHPTRDGETDGPAQGHMMRSSAYTRTMLSDVSRVLPFLAAGAMLFAAKRRYGRAA